MTTDPATTEPAEPEGPGGGEAAAAGAPGADTSDTPETPDTPDGGADADDGEATEGPAAAGDGAAAVDDGTPEPGDGSAEPGNGSAAAGDGATVAGDGTPEPGDGSAAVDDGATVAGDGTPEPGDGTAEPGDGSAAAGDGSAAADDGATVAGDGAAVAGDGTPDGTPGDASDLSEAQAELVAQRVERERIERRKAEKAAPIDSGSRLSGTAADLLAAVRAVESGRKPVSTAFAEPEPAPRRAAPEPVRRPQPAAPPPAAAAPARETVDAVRAVLAQGGAPESLATPVAAALGDGAAGELRADPWQLLRVAGVRPEQADGFARALLGAECGPDDERRGRALTVRLLEQAALAGHTALEVPALAAALGRYAVPDPDAAVRSTVAEGEALVFQDALDPTAPAAAPAEATRSPEDDTEAAADTEEERPVRVLIGSERYALAEESLADGLARVINSLPKEDPADWSAAAASAPGAAADLIRAVAGHGLVLHTGGEASRAEPAALLAAAHTLGLRAWAAAHGPDGRQRFARLLAAAAGDGTGGAPREAQDALPPVTTVAGLLSGAQGPGRDADGALDLDLLVVLDAPQLDVETAAVLAESLPDGARLVLSGDPGVLWSAGPGRVFADLLAARVCPQVASRTPDPGPLGELVSGIGIGELNQVGAPGKEIVIVPVRDAGEAVHRTVQLVVDSVPRAIGVPAEHTQVITPGHGGAAGTRALNTALKERLNPGPGRFGGFDPGDRIAWSPAPGRTVPGRVVGADADGLRLECAGAPVVVPRERVERSVRHGWALTAHQAVGQRWPAVVVVLPGDAAQALTRPWIYTAFGRAERHLSVVHGVEQALPRAVAEVPAAPRTTRLVTLLKTQVPTVG